MTETPDRRRMARVSVPRQLSGPALEPQMVRLLDLSLGGVRIEHLEPLREGVACVVDLPAALGHTQLSGRVVWTAVRGGEQTLEGERRLRYQSGVAFAGLTEKQGAAITAAIEILKLAHDGQERRPSS